MLKEFRTANAAIGDHAALMEMLNADGYLFFRDALDREVLAEVYSRYMRALYEHGYVPEVSGEPKWLGTDAKELDDFAVGELRSLGIGAWYVQHQSTKDFYADLFGESMEWFPGSGRMNVVHRCTGPARNSQSISNAEPDIFIGRHQDAFYNTGIEMYTTWIPLMDISPAIGGLAIASGVHKNGMLHDTAVPPDYPIPRGAIPETAWRTTSYEPGDVLVFTGSTPHSAIPNTSSLIRLSMDLRIIPAWASSPVIGVLTEASAQRIAVTSERHGLIEVEVSEVTTIFGLSRTLLSPTELAGEDLPVGTTVMVGIADGFASVIRPPVLPHKEAQQHPGRAS
jgi:hypothetical protein